MSSSQSTDDSNKTHKVVIIGSGPAAHTAAIYGGRAELSPLMFEGLMAGGIAPGGQLTTTTEVENFPGFPEGVSGIELMDMMRRQSVKYGTEILTQTVDEIDLSVRPFKVVSQGKSYSAEALILATGATAKRLNVRHEENFWQKGISACAVCDGPLPIFKNKKLFVIGGGDSACEEAIFLTKYGEKIFLVHRRDSLRASKIMVERVKNNPKIEIIWNYTLEDVAGDGVLNKVILKSTVDGKISEYDAGGLFYAIGHTPNVTFLNGQLNTDEAGYIITSPGTTATSVEGVFAAGDVQDKKYRQAITAAGSGCMALMEAEHYLNAHQT